MTELFVGSNIEELMLHMFVYIKIQTENPCMSESGFTLDQIIHLHINLHRLALSLCSSFTELCKWIALKNAVINPKNNGEWCFKLAVIAALHYEEIAKDPHCIPKV